jgi:hypothetical protein
MGNLLGMCSNACKVGKDARYIPERVLANVAARAVPTRTDIIVGTHG